MLKTISFLFLFLLLASCGKSGSGGSDSGEAIQEVSDTGDSIILEEVGTGLPLTSAAINFDIELELYQFDAEQEDKVLEAADLIKEVVASEEFRDMILTHKVKGKKTFVDNDGLTNKQIYQKIIEGSEKLKPGKDNTMNLELESYQKANKTVGYTYPSSIRVWMNKKYLNKYKSWKVTTNMMHEWLHKLGFKHDKKSTPTRKYSVPYAVGYLVAELAKKK